MQSCAKAQPLLRLCLLSPLFWQCLASATEGVRLAARIVDTPCNEMNTDNFLEVGDAPDQWQLLIGSPDCSNQTPVLLALSESCVSAAGGESNWGAEALLWPFIFHRTVQSWKEAEFAAWNRALGS